MTYHYPGEIVGDFKAMRHKRSGQWLWRCVHCRAEKTASFVMMHSTGMQHCTCQKPLLTPAQKRVAEHVALGLQNKEVARRLVISEKTVQMHLHHVYAKLNLRNRTELALYMQRRIR